MNKNGKIKKKNIYSNIQHINNIFNKHIMYFQLWRLQTRRNRNKKQLKQKSN